LAFEEHLLSTSLRHSLISAKINRINLIYLTHNSLLTYLQITKSIRINDIYNFDIDLIIITRMHGSAVHCVRSHDHSIWNKKLSCRRETAPRFV